MTITDIAPWLRRPRPQVGAPPPDTQTLQAVADAVRQGLLPARKSLPPWLLYDRRGSELFEEITELPEYYLTRTERAILATHAADMIDAAGPPLSIVELGAGTASKTHLLLHALLERQPGATYMPVDVSPAALALAEEELSRFRRLTVRTVVARYPEELGFLDALPGRRLLLFLGSNIGNYDPPAARALLQGVRRHLAPGDACLVGTDLRKSQAVLLPAYDDAQGVTARFNKNVLARINRDLDANFDLDRFHHVVKWNRTASRLELYLQSVGAQRVILKKLGAEVRFAPGQRIHTESSYKFTSATIERLFTQADFRLEKSWYDERRWFGLHLARVPAPAHAAGAAPVNRKSGQRTGSRARVRAAGGRGPQSV